MWGRKKKKYVPVKRPTNYMEEKNVLSKVVMSESRLKTSQ